MEDGFEEQGGARPQPLSLAELKRLYKPPHNTAQELKDSLLWHERFAVWVTERVGSVGFFMIILCWSIVWVIWNVVAPEPLQFDPYPSFVIWLIISNMIQILLMPLMLIGQNLQTRNFEKDAEADYELNRKSNHEIETILIHLENQNELIEDLHKRFVGRS